MNIEIRKATRQDIADILHITKDAFIKYAKELGQPDKVVALNETEDTVFHDLNTKTVLVGLVDGVAQGSVRYEKIPGNLAYITRFGVKQDAQKCGIGKLLIDTVIKDCIESGISAVALHTCTKMQELVRYYYSQGFYIHSTTQDRGYVRGLFLRELTNETHETLDLTYVSKL